MSDQHYFKPAWWLSNTHAQTLWPSLLRRPIQLQLRRERIELPDGDFVDLDWGENKSGPLAIIFHGLEGSGKSNYVRGMMRSLTQHGWQTVVMHFRGCSDEPNRLARAYHSGDTGDISYVIKQLHERMPDSFIAAIGYSLGGNALLKWIGETEKNINLNAAVAVSVPFDLDNAAHTLRHSGNGIYQNHLLKNLKQTVLDKRDLLESHIDIESALQSKNFHEFDHRVTAKLHGFTGVDDYYAQSSSKQYIHAIRTPTLILHAEDDPFLDKSTIPAEIEIPDSVTLELSKHGGHVGFIDSQGYWLERRIPDFLNKLIR
ncbi:MAG: hydrolase [Sulfuriflexus sp.]|nr:hydrolase [Sulfuriflexus sp.]